MTTRSALVVLAGGVGSRMQTGPGQAGGNKVYLSILDKEILAYSLETIDHSDLVDLVVLVIRPDDQEQGQRLLAESVRRHDSRIAFGGANRQASERAGVEAIAEEIERGQIDVVAVHDGARPFLSGPLLERVLTEAAASGGAIPGLAVDDVLGSTEHDGLLPADEYVWVQTPQGYDGSTLLQAHRRALADDWEAADTAEVVDRYSGQATAIVAGEPTNIKVTFRDDLALAETYAASWSPGGPSAASAPGTGPGPR